MNTHNLGNKLTKNRTALVIVIGLAAIAIVGSYSLASVAAQSTNDTAQSQTNSQPPMKERPKIEGSVNVQQDIITGAKVKFSDAANAAAASVDGGKVIGGRLGVEQNYLVYQFTVLDSSNQIHMVVVDAGNGKVLYTSSGFDADVQMLLGGHGEGHGEGHGFMGKPGMQHSPPQNPTQ